MKNFCKKKDRNTAAIRGFVYFSIFCDKDGLLENLLDFII